MIGASEVKSIHYISVSNSSTRVTIVTPTSGKKVRISSALVVSNDASVTRFEVYFDTGASITTTPSKAILEVRLESDLEKNHSMVWPDGGGPVGAVDDVVSFRATPDIADRGSITVHYREE